MSDGLQQKYRQDKLGEDIAKLEAAMFGPESTEDQTSKTAEQDKQVLDNKNVVTPDQSTSSDEVVTDNPFATVTADKDTRPDGNEMETLRVKYSELEHRFNRFKGKSDRTIFDQRSEIGRLNKLVAGLNTSNLELQAKQDELDSKLGEDEQEIFGTEGAKLIETMTSKIKGLERQLSQKDSSQYIQAAETAETTNESEFMDKLTELVPDVDTMNKDPEFVDWLHKTDSHGIERIATLRADQARLDYVRVAGFFNEYKQMSAKIAKVKDSFQDSADAYTGPTGTQSGDSTARVENADTGEIKQSEINAYEQEVSQGKHKYNSAYCEAMEEKIFIAAGKGKIIHDVPPTRSFKVR